MDIRQRPQIIAVIKPEKTVFTRICTVSAAEIGGSGSEHETGARFMTAKTRNLTRVIPRTRFRAITLFLLLIDHDQTKIDSGSKNRASRADNDMRAAPLDTLPFIASLACGCNANLKNFVPRADCMYDFFETSW